jgi:hypothetical protein
MARLQLTYSDLYTSVSSFLGFTTTGTAPTGTDLTTCQSIIARGMRQFLYPVDMRTGKLHNWQFLKTYHTFETVDGQWKYALPIDFSDMYSNVIHYDSEELQPPIVRRDADQILEMRSDVVTKEWPQYFAITPAKFDMDVGTMYELWLYPTPDQAYSLVYFYRFDPIKLSATTDVIVGGIRVCEAILETCLAVAETQEEDGASTIHQQESQRLIQILISADKIQTTGKIGNLYRSDRSWPPARPYLVGFQDANIYSGVTPTDEFAM